MGALTGKVSTLAGQKALTEALRGNGLLSPTRQHTVLDVCNNEGQYNYKAEDNDCDDNKNKPIVVTTRMMLWMLSSSPEVPYMTRLTSASVPAPCVSAVWMVTSYSVKLSCVGALLGISSCACKVISQMVKGSAFHPVPAKSHHKWSNARQDNLFAAKQSIYSHYNSGVASSTQAAIRKQAE